MVSILCEFKNNSTRHWSKTFTFETVYNNVVLLGMYMHQSNQHSDREIDWLKLKLKFKKSTRHNHYNRCSCIPFVLFLSAFCIDLQLTITFPTKLNNISGSSWSRSKNATWKKRLKNECSSHYHQASYMFNHIIIINMPLRKYSFDLSLTEFEWVY